MSGIWSGADLGRPCREQTGEPPRPDVAR